MRVSLSSTGETSKRTNEASRPGAKERVRSRTVTRQQGQRPRTSSAAYAATRAVKLTPGPNAPSSAGQLAGCFALLPEPRGDGLQPWTEVVDG